MKTFFVYGTAVGGENFTGREAETARLKANFENGINTLLISPRRMGKTSLVQKVKAIVNGKKIAVVYLDMFDCRSEYDFYNKLVTAVLEQTASRKETIFQNIKGFPGRLSPRISFSPDPQWIFHFRLESRPRIIRQKKYSVLPSALPKSRNGISLFASTNFSRSANFRNPSRSKSKCGESGNFKKRFILSLRQQEAFDDKYFQSKSMTFYQFGDAVYPGTIPVEKWASLICKKFGEKSVSITKKNNEQVARHCKRDSSQFHVKRGHGKVSARNKVQYCSH